ncbi:MAG: hypothetical protein IKP00_13110 [Victivallales bacterium]|nr:hypothetical protein [Victivallales bacterium]
MESSVKQFFIPCCQVVANEKCDIPSILVNNSVICNFTASSFPVCTIETGGFLLLDFGKELSGGIRLVSGMMKPATLRLRFGESIAEACGEPNMDHAIHDVVLPLNLLTCMDFGNTGFRYVRLDVLEGQVKLVNAIAIASMQELEQIGSFTSSDQRLNQIFDTAVYTAHLCIQEHILDGVKRDRLLWGGDLHPITSAILPVFGSIDALDVTLEQLCFNTKEECFANNHTSYPLWLIMTIHDWYMHSGDASILQKYGDYITKNTQKYLAMVKEDGQLEMPGYLFLDWLSHDDTEGTLAGLYGLFILAMKAAENLYCAMHLDTMELVEAQKRVAFKAPFPGRNKSAAALQHLAGVADRRDILQAEPFSGISTFIGGYILQCLEPRAALELVKRYWGGMLDMGATTFWEDFDLDWLKANPTRIDEMPVPNRPNIHADYGRFCYKGVRHSLCHGWSSGPIPWCIRTILGIKVLEPGLKRIAFAPNLCGLEFAEGNIATPVGKITVKLRAGKEPEICTPEGVTVES